MMRCGCSSAEKVKVSGSTLYGGYGVSVDWRITGFLCWKKWVSPPDQQGAAKAVRFKVLLPGLVPMRSRMEDV